LKTEGTLAERLMAALTAGDLAGGQKTGRESAALLVKTMDGFPMDIDLRVDDSNDPVGGLRKLFDMQSARQQVIQASLAARAGHLDQARVLLIGAIARGHDWTRVWIRAARVAENIEEPRLALKYIDAAFTQNQAWADAEIGEGNYAEIGASAEFHRWVSAEKEKNAVAAYEQLRELKNATLEMRVLVGRILLEAGHANEGIVVLNERTQRVEESIELRLLRSTAYEAVKDHVNAMAQCDAALKSEPKNLRVRMRLEELQREATQ
jgi:hypothetical protein